MRTASSPALRALPMATVATGTPAGICTMESSESSPRSALRRHRHADHRQRRMRGEHPGQVGRAARPRDDHPQAARRAPCARTRPYRRACDAPRRCAAHSPRRSARTSPPRRASSADRSRCPSRCRPRRLSPRASRHAPPSFPPRTCRRTSRWRYAPKRSAGADDMLLWRPECLGNSRRRWCS